MEARSCQPAAPFPGLFRSGRSAKRGPQKAVDIDVDWESEAAQLAEEEASLEVRDTFLSMDATCHMVSQLCSGMPFGRDAAHNGILVFCGSACSSCSLEIWLLSWGYLFRTMLLYQTCCAC